MVGLHCSRTAGSHSCCGSGATRSPRHLASCGGAACSIYGTTLYTPRCVAMSLGSRQTAVIAYKLPQFLCLERSASTIMVGRLRMRWAAR